MYTSAVSNVQNGQFILQEQMHDLQTRVASQAQHIDSLMVRNERQDEIIVALCEHRSKNLERHPRFYHSCANESDKRRGSTGASLSMPEQPNNTCENNKYDRENLGDPADGHAPISWDPTGDTRAFSDLEERQLWAFSATLQGRVASLEQKLEYYGCAAFCDCQSRNLQGQLDHLEARHEDNKVAVDTGLRALQELHEELDQRQHSIQQSFAQVRQKLNTSEESRSVDGIRIDGRVESVEMQQKDMIATQQVLDGKVQNVTSLSLGLSKIFNELQKANERRKCDNENLSAQVTQNATLAEQNAEMMSRRQKTLTSSVAASEIELAALMRRVAATEAAVGRNAIHDADTTKRVWETIRGEKSRLALMEEKGKTLNSKISAISQALYALREDLDERPESTTACPNTVMRCDELAALNDKVHGLMMFKDEIAAEMEEIRYICHNAIEDHTNQEARCVDLENNLSVVVRQNDTLKEKLGETPGKPLYDGLNDFVKCVASSVKKLTERMDSIESGKVGFQLDTVL